MIATIWEAMEHHAHFWSANDGIQECLWCGETRQSINPTPKKANRESQVCAPVFPICKFESSPELDKQQNKYMKQILIVRPDTLNAKDKEKLTKNGFLWIEHPNPEEVKIVVETTGASADDITLSALYALDRTYPMEAFAKELARRMGAVRTEPKP